MVSSFSQSSSDRIFLDRIMKKLSPRLMSIMKEDYDLRYPAAVMKPEVDSPAFFTITGPTGSGKTLLASYILSNFDGYWVPRLTNRSPRVNERRLFSDSPLDFVENNIYDFRASREEFDRASHRMELKTSEYIFVSDEFFEQENEELLVTSTYPPNNKKYAIHTGIVEKIIEAATAEQTVSGMVGGLEMESILSEVFKNKINFFVLPGSIDVLASRLERKFETEYAGNPKFRDEIDRRKMHGMLEFQMYLEMVGKIHYEKRLKDSISSFEIIKNDDKNDAYSKLAKNIGGRLKSVLGLESILADEYIPLVSKDDEFSGMYFSKRHSHTIGSWHRVSALYLVNEDNQVCLQKRSPGDVDGGKYDHTICGHVNKDDMESARKEIDKNIVLENRIYFENEQIRNKSYVNALEREMMEEGGKFWNMGNVIYIGNVFSRHKRGLNEEAHHYGTFFIRSNELPESQEAGVTFELFDPIEVEKSIEDHPDLYAEGLKHTYPVFMEFLKGKLPRWKKNA